MKANNLNQGSSSSALSSTALDFEDLPEALQTMLAEAVDEYVISTEEGRPLDKAEFLSKYDPIHEPLSAFLEQIDWLREESSEPSPWKEELKNDSVEQSSTGLSYDDFEIDSELGRGAMGIVYKAFQNSLQRWVAIKVLPYGTLLDEHRTLRFWREARIAGAIEHPGIVSVYGYGRHKDICFYAMPLVEGRSLDRHIRDNEPKSLLHGRDRYQNIARILAEAADAIHAAHLAGVVHRDIKPSNLIVDAQGRVKVTDFGLAVDTADLGLTRSGEIVGTIRYMSPEQAAGKRGLVDQRSDIYCLGATLYELLTFQPPFASESLADVVREKEEGLLIPPRTIDSTIPRALQTITLKAMRADPRDRYQSAFELAEDLRNYLSGRPISAVDQSFMELLTGWARRNAGIVLVGAFSLAMLLVIAVIFSIATKSQSIALRKALDDRDRSFERARQAVNELGIEFAEKLELIPEATELRRDLLRSSLSYYADFLDESNGDAMLTQAVAESKWKAAQATAGLETLVEAAKMYEEADEELAELAKSQPKFASIRAEMLSDWAMRYMGEFQGEESDPIAALAILERMSSDDEGVPVRSRALLKNNLAFVLTSLRRTNESIELASKAVELLEQEKGDGSDSNTRSLCVSMLNLCQALEKSGQIKTALNVAKQCELLAEKLPKSSSDIQTCQLRAKTLATLAALQWKHQGPKAAIEGLKSVVEIHRSQLELWPHSIEYRWDLAVALNNLGMAISAVDSNDHSLNNTARQTFEKAYAIAKAETETDSNNALAAQRAANIQNNLGLLLRKMGLNSEADIALRCAKSHIDRALLLDSDNDSVTKSRNRIDLNLKSN